MQFLKQQSSYLSVALGWLFLLAVPAEAACFRVLVTEPIPGMEKLLIPCQSGTPEAIYLSTTHISPKYDIPADGRVDFYKKLPESPQEQIPPIFSVQFPEPLHDMIVLLMAQGSGDEKTYRPILIDDSDSGFPAGSIMIYNFLGKPLMAKMGEDIISVDSGKREIVELARNEDTPFNDGVKFATEFNGEGRVFSSSAWYLLPSMKFFCIVYEDAKGMPHVRRIRMPG